jgi:hypothetical protein
MLCPPNRAFKLFKLIQFVTCIESYNVPTSLKFLIISNKTEGKKQEEGSNKNPYDKKL